MIDFTEASDALANLIASVTVDDLDRSTPCAEYVVSDLLMHIDEGATGFASAAGGALSSPPVAGVDDDVSRHRIGNHLRDLAGAWSNPVAWDGDSDLAGLGLSNETWGKIALTEVIVHGWDLSVATGRAFTPPEKLVRACCDHLDPVLKDAPVPELWGPKVQMEGGSVLERAVAIAGRDPEVWRDWFGQV